ncbi:peptidylprolyl isomerase [Picosynechococcus sp. PCC 7003]|uniref:peptidylprolyl isomerase n=1 Tax=Picosynechococcus sp. PCC 7003 TaxID=374981 RepID=UPI0008108A48|nr:peptidylprolyl isomerase [Picosynechococcus sp. PCC 7003]ANV85222.1 peptidylprolyl isomerase [Picosynechococcus sp. PCC 7003]
MTKFLKYCLSVALAIAVCFGVTQAAWALPQPSFTLASLAQGDAITDPEAILRYALPIENKPIRRLQDSMEFMSKDLRAKRWGPIAANAKKASRVLSISQDGILEDVVPSFKEQAKTLLDEMEQDVATMREAIAAKDRETIWTKRREILNKVGVIEENMIAEYPTTIPEDYADLPRLLGRATVELKTTQGDITVVVDGYNAPINAGNFVDLVQRGFYDGLPFNRAEDLYILQTGDPEGDADGFIDPKTKEYRAIPMEIMLTGDHEATYGATLEELGIYLAEINLPFNAYGALALARPADDANGGSSQIFFFKFDNELAPPGFNLMDGRYSVFGYTVAGQDVLENLSKADKIISAKVVNGSENLVVSN